MLYIKEINQMSLTSPIKERIHSISHQLESHWINFYACDCKKLKSKKKNKTKQAINYFIQKTGCLIG
jgi:hypothetical protein